jgi:hypothetical protein
MIDIAIMIANKPVELDLPPYLPNSKSCPERR